MKKILLILLAVCLCFGMSACGDTDANNGDVTRSRTDNSVVPTTTTYHSDYHPSELFNATNHVQIDFEDYGTVTLELYGELAPITVENFLNLAESGFYDGLTIHRIYNGYLIQGGDPEGNGTGGSDETIKGEFAENGVENDLKHVRGVISMARSQDYDSASSQFFIMSNDESAFDGNYAAFGYVTEGMEVIDQIIANTPVADANGTVLAFDQPTISKITVID